jgi:hypothetical protein
VAIQNDTISSIGHQAALDGVGLSRATGAGP